MQSQKIAILSKNAVLVSNCMVSLKGITYKYLYFHDLSDLELVASKYDISLLIIDASSLDDELAFIKKINKLIIPLVEDVIAIVENCSVNKKLYFNIGVSACITVANVISELGLVAMELIGEQTQIEQAVSQIELPIDTSGLLNLNHKNIINKTLSFLQKNLAKVKSIDDLIMAIKENESSINLAFLDGFGKTFSEFMRWYRIEKSKNMLLKTKYTINKIAKNVGYSSAPNFSTAFKAQEGLTPSQYRSMHRSKKD
ncbi:helix-turn-helix domain-containing protein [Paenalcaligenes hominis]|uniref:helix-turn-helix domain-containing protein n=1 Tax=Paenalcaligenes hominis TaxID=643674 RepID=UPI0035250CDD